LFTIEQINDAHERLGSAATLAQYVHELRSIGVERYSSYLSDGHSEYFGKDGSVVSSPAVHETPIIADTSNREQFLEHLELHNQQKTSYVEMSRGLASCGIEKWAVDATLMTMTFYDKAGNQMLVEAIE
jgi:uncharacterized protein YbcV (DUF1398 family)